MTMMKTYPRIKRGAMPGYNSERAPVEENIDQN